MTVNNYEYGDEAQTEKRYEDLAPKSKAVVDAIVDSRDGNVTQTEIADNANCTDTHVTYVKSNFPHIIEDRNQTMRVAADGGEGVYDVAFTPTETFKAIKLLPEDLSKKMFNQIRQQSVDAGEGLGALFEQDE